MLTLKAERHHFDGVRGVQAVSGADRLRINDISNAVTTNKLTRPFWEINSYIVPSKKDFSSDSTYAQRLPDNVLKNTAVIRGLLGQPDPAPSPAHYPGPLRVLHDGNETWFQSRFQGDQATYDAWRKDTDGSSANLKKVQVDLAVPTHPIDFYIEDTLAGVNWYGDTGVVTSDKAGKDTKSDKMEIDKIDKVKKAKPEIKIDKSLSAAEALKAKGEAARLLLEVGKPPSGAKKGLKRDGKTPRSVRGKWCKVCFKMTTSLGKEKGNKHFAKCYDDWAGDSDDHDPSDGPDDNKKDKGAAPSASATGGLFAAEGRTSFLFVTPNTTNRKRKPAEIETDSDDESEGREEESGEEEERADKRQEADEGEVDEEVGKIKASNSEDIKTTASPQTDEGVPIPQAAVRAAKKDTQNAGIHLFLAASLSVTFFRIISRTYSSH
ncbi:hypothetical protein ABW20_dc0100118 [Dactylellina cionopaga]|nr:hypothetical protein ABW20_dc0100118 [Dactylellina cionopaga]